MLRLKTRSQFQAGLAGNKLASSAHFVVHHLAAYRPAFNADCNPAEADGRTALFSRSDLWLGPLIPKKWAKRAVTRNAIKRQIFNVARDFETVLPLGAYVIRLRSGFAKKQFSSASSDHLKQTVREELCQLMAKVVPPGGHAPQPGLPK